MEVVTVACIVAILAAVAIPTYLGYINNQKVAAVTNIAKAAAATLASNFRRNGNLTLAQETDVYLKTLITIPNPGYYVISVGPSGDAKWVQVREKDDASIISPATYFRNP